MLSSKAAARTLGVCVGILLGVVASYIQPANATRNSSGTYSLPAGNPVVSGTTITSATHNSTMSDIGTELTDSLSRSGKGGMSAALQLASGTVAAPGLSFTSDTDCGLYRIGANNVGLALNGAKVVDYATTGVAVTGTLSSTGAATFSTTAAVTGNATVGGTLGVTGVSSLANGAVGAPGLTFTSDPDTGIYRIGADNLGLAVNGTKIVDVATTGATVVGAVAASGNLSLTGSDPSSSTGFSSILTPTNIPKAWAVINGNGGSAATILNGFNVTNIQEVGNTVTVDFTTDFDSANCACVGNIADTSINLAVSCAAATATLSGYNIPGAAAASVPGTSANISIVCFGAN